jgi:uncharacterized protein (TIGR00369 family)
MIRDPGRGGRGRASKSGRHDTRGPEEPTTEDQRLMKRSEWYLALKKRVNEAPLSRWIGQRLTQVGRGRAEVVLAIREEHLQRQGQLHGGWYGFISDTAGFFATMSLCGPEDSATTLEYKVNLLAPTTPEDSPVTARARVLRKTGSIAVAYMEVTDGNGTICSTGIGTYRIFPGRASSRSGAAQASGARVSARGKARPKRRRG